MNNNSKKVFTIIIISILAITLFTTTTFANSSFHRAEVLQGGGGGGTSQSDAIANSIHQAQNFGNRGTSTIIDYKNLKSVIDYAYNIAMTIAIIVAIIVGTILGIRIIFGGIDEKADAKHLMVPYLVILFMVAFAFTLWKIAITIIYDLS